MDNVALTLGISTKILEEMLEKCKKNRYTLDYITDDEHRAIIINVLVLALDLDKRTYYRMFTDENELDIQLNAFNFMKNNFYKLDY